MIRVYRSLTSDEIYLTSENLAELNSARQDMQESYDVTDTVEFTDPEGQSGFRFCLRQRRN